MIALRTCTVRWRSEVTLQRGAWVDYDSYIIEGKEYRSHVVDDPIFGNVSHFAFGIKKASSQARLAFHISARVGQPPAVGVLGRRREEERSLATLHAAKASFWPRAWTDGRQVGTGSTECDGRRR